MERLDENLAALERLLGEPPLAVLPHAPGEVHALVLTQAAQRLAPQPISF
jgi:hypothetical protein